MLVPVPCYTKVELTVSVTLTRVNISLVSRDKLLLSEEEGAKECSIRSAVMIISQGSLTFFPRFVRGGGTSGDSRCVAQHL